MKEFFDYNVLEIGKYSFKLFYKVNFLIFLIVIVVFSIASRRLIYRSKSPDVAKKFSVNKLFQYKLITLSLLISLHILQFDITVLMAGSAAALVGLGFGLQNLFNGFISGIVLLLNGTQKVGNIIEVNGATYTVQEINFRTTTAAGRNEDNVILPNSQLTGNSVINRAHSQLSARFKISIGADYDTDVLLLMKILKEVTQRNELVLKSPGPFVRFEDYGDSALLFSICFFTNKIFRVENIKRNIRIEVFKELKKHGISIYFPQNALHFRNKLNIAEPPSTES